MRHLDLLQQIRGDTNAIRKALADPARSPTRTMVPGRATNAPIFSNRQVIVLGERLGKKIAASAPSKAGTKAAVVAAAAVSAVATRKAGKPFERARNGNGQFGSGEPKDPNKKPDSGVSSGGESKIGAAGTAVRDGVSGITSGAEQLDPTLAAGKEVKDMLGPVTKIFKPLGGLFGRKGKSEEEKVFQKELPWYKKIWKELKTLGGKPAAGGGEGTGIMTMLKGAVLLPLLGLILPALAIAGAGAVGAFIGNWINDKFGQQIGDMIWDASEWVKETWTKVGEVWTSAGNWIKTSWNEATTTLSNAAKSISDWVDGLTGKANELLNKGTDKARDFKESAVDSAKNVASFVTGGRYTGGSDSNKAALVQAMNGAGIKDPKEQAMFMSQMSHESGGFRRLEENLNYSPERLMQVSATARGKGLEAVTAATRQGPEAVAELMYGGRMGNTAAGDGYKFRGRGFTQLTGKDNYAAAGKDLGLDLVNNPELAAQPENAGKISAWYWKKNGLGAAGQAGDVASATRRINGGLNGLSDRQAEYDKYLKETTAGNYTVQTGNDSQAVAPASVNRALATAMPNAIPPVRTTGIVPIGATSAAPDLTKYAPAATPAVPSPLASSGKSGAQTVNVDTGLSQNLSDRGIAAVATGGIGMNK